MTEKIRFAIVGCGGIAAKHLSALSRLKEEAQLVAVADVDGRHAQVMAAEQGVPCYQEASVMLSRHPEIDVVNVLVPSGLHAGTVLELAPFGKHIVTEKPMALRVEDCERMVAACEMSGSRLFVVYQNRYLPQVLLARKALEAGRFGKLVMGSVRVRWCRRQEYYDRSNWHGTWALDGGVMAQQASHHLDLLAWFLGPIESLQCQTATRLLDIEVEDSAAAIMKFQCGALGVFEATVATRPVDLEGSLSILGEKGSVVIAGVLLNDLQAWRFSEELPEDAALRGASSQPGAASGLDPHALYLADVIRAVRQGAPVSTLVEGQEGKRAVETLQALYESAAHGGASVHPGEPCLSSRLGRQA